MTKLWLAAPALCAITLGAAEKQVQMKDLPAAVQQAIQEQTKGAEIKGLTEEKEKGHIEYEAETLVNGKVRDLLFDQRGTLVEVEQEVDINTLPGAARAAIEKYAAGGKLSVVETVTKGSVTNYEGHYTKGGKEREVKVDANGKLVKD
jgi:hypothetical protein